MGYDKLLSFFTKNLNSSLGEELFNEPTIVTNHVYFDMNFILYDSIGLIENEINSILQIIFALPYTDIQILEDKLSSIFNLYHWKAINVPMHTILDGETIEDIIKNFNEIIHKYIYDILYNHIYTTIINNIEITHPIQYIKTLNLFFDGIPTYAKIIEQRRRRMKNYIDSKNRQQIFKTHFENVIDNLVTENGICFDYFEWLKHQYSFDKSIGPHSNILNLLIQFLQKALVEKYTNIKIYIDNSTNYGESDYKIFKHIKDNKIDCDVAIHTRDSDFIFLIIWYQLLGNVKSIDINIMTINYTISKTSMISGKKIINQLLERYSYINNCSDNISNNVIFDLLLLLLMFGNDIMPINYQIGTELNLKLLFETHYTLYKTNQFIININNIEIINFNNLIIWLKLIKNRNSFSIIILSRFYKLSYNTILQITENYNLSNLAENTIFALQPNEVDYGLIRNQRGFEITNNPYQTLYNYIVLSASNSTNDDFNRPVKIFFDDLKNAEDSYKDLVKDCNVEQYLSLLVYISQIFFYNFDLYTPYSFMHCSDFTAPSIDMIIDYVESNDMRLFQQRPIDVISAENYFNPISHHLFITPYLLESNYIDSIKVEHVKSLLNIVNSHIPGIWYTTDNSFILKKIDPYKFTKLCNDLIKMYQDTFINKIFKATSNLLE